MLRDKETCIYNEICRPVPSFISEDDLTDYLNIYFGLLSVYARFLPANAVSTFIENSLYHRYKYICGMVMDREQFEIVKVAAAYELLSYGEI